MFADAAAPQSTPGKRAGKLRRVFTWIGNRAYAGHEAPDAVQEVMRLLGDISVLPGLRSADGGIKRDDVLDALVERRKRAGLADERGSHFDALDRSHRIALRVETGRAHTNNDGLLAVLETARHPGVDVLVLVVPTDYKGSVTADKVRERVQWLLSGPGIDLALTGVALTGY